MDNVRNYPKTDLVGCTASAFMDCLGHAFDMGRRAEMHGWPDQTGAAIADRLTTRRRRKHEATLRAVFMAGRAHIADQGEP